jgi:hypothetical protein
MKCMNSIVRQFYMANLLVLSFVSVAPTRKSKPIGLGVGNLYSQLNLLPI